MYNKCGQKIVHIVFTKAQMKQKAYTFQKIWEGFFDTPCAWNARSAQVTTHRLSMTVAVAVAIEEASK